MALAHVLLTSLMEKPSSGSELARRFDKSMGFFWNASHQQIYRELAHMLDKGWISTLDADDDGEQKRKKIYQVEQSGRVALANWMHEHSEPGQLREDLMVRLRAEAQLNTHILSPELQRHLQLHQSKLALYQRMYTKDFSQGSAEHATQNRVMYIQQMILKLGIQSEQTWVNWLQEMIAQLTNFEKINA